MLSKNQVKYINSLKIKKFRHEHGVFIIEGEKGVGELLNSSLVITGIFALPRWIEENIRLLEAKQVNCTVIDEDMLARISDLTTPNKVLALARIPKPQLSPVVFSNYLLLLDNIKDPGNMGTIIRTADWFGIRHMICSPGCVDAYNPKVVQAAMGSLTRVNIHYTELVKFIKGKPENIPVYGALLYGENIINTSFDKQGMIIIGSESHGISPEILPLITHAVHIPTFSHNEAITITESLNASIANAIICYEMSKQLSKKKLE